MPLLGFPPFEVNFWQLLAVTAIGLTTYSLTNAIYQLYFSPLSKIPGPWYAAVSPAFYLITCIRGNTIYSWDRLHSQYGPYVRVAPSVIMICDPESAKKIHSSSDVFRKGSWYENSERSMKGIVFITDPEEYRGRRRVFGNVFSKSNTALLEPAVRRHMEVCYKKIGKRLDNGEIVNMKKWLHWAAADIGGLVCFGEDFGMIKDEFESSIVEGCVNFTIVAGVQAYIPYFKHITWFLSFIPYERIQWFCRNEEQLRIFSADILQRIKREIQGCKDGHPRPSLFSAILDSVDNPHAKYKLEKNDLVSDAATFMIGAVDTSAILATYMTWIIFRHPNIKKKLIAELKSIGWTQGDHDDGITDEMLQELPYFNMFLQESLRFYAPVQFGLSRVVPDGGRLLGQYFIPGGTECFAPAYTLHRDPKIFDDPLT
ncbi:hypothetical protein TWF718_002465 [Orbilia javanica]